MIPFPYLHILAEPGRCLRDDAVVGILVFQHDVVIERVDILRGGDSDEACHDRGFDDPGATLNRILSLDEERRATIQKLQEAQARRNAASKRSKPRRATSDINSSRSRKWRYGAAGLTPAQSSV